MKFTFDGDSNPAGNYVSGSGNMVNLIATALSAAAINLAVSGRKAQGVLDHISDATSQNPNAAFCMIGTNDGAYANDNAVDVSTWGPTYLATMGSVIDAYKTASIQQIYIASPPVARIKKLCDDWPEVVLGLKALCATKGVNYVPVYEMLIAEGATRLGLAAQTRWMLVDPDKYHGDTAWHAAVAQVFIDAYHAANPPSGHAWNSAQSGTGLVYSSGDLTLQQVSGTAGGSAIGTVGKSTGKFYFELTYTTPASLTAALLGFTKGAYNTIINLASTGSDDFWYDSAGRLNTNGSPAEATGKTIWDGSGNIVGAAIDANTGKIWFKDKNGAWLTATNDTDVVAGNNADFNGGSGGTWFPIAGIMSGAANANVVTANFDGPFAHSVPSGFGTF